MCVFQYRKEPGWPILKDNSDLSGTGLNLEANCEIMKDGQVDTVFMLQIWGRWSGSKNRDKSDLLITKAGGFSEATRRSSILPGIS